MQPLRAATECEVDLVRKRPDHGNGLRPWIPKQRPEFHLCATESQRLNLNPLTWTSPCEGLVDLDVDYIVPMHCTGEPFYEILKAELPKKVIRSYTGTKLVFRA